MTKKIAYRNKSPTGWWIASYIERPVWDDAKKPSSKTRCHAWENTIILKARNRDEAFAKAIKLGTDNTSTFQDKRGKRTGHWEFMGLTDLLPIYDELEDGSEIMWGVHNRTYAALQRGTTKNKKELSVFDDTPAVGDMKS